MPRPKKQDQDLTNIAELMKQMQASLEAARAENAQLRDQVVAQTQATAHHQARHAAMNPLHAVNNSELMVGIRNISDNVVGIFGFPKGAPDITLNPGLPGSDNSSAVISYVHWTRLRGGDLMKKGFLVRDDSVLGTAFTPAPADLPNDIPEAVKVNMIEDPEQWIDSRSEEELVRDINKITSEDSLRRLRGAVDRWIFNYQKTLPEPYSVKAAREALSRVPLKLAKVDSLVTELLEKPDNDGEPISNIKLNPADVARMRSAIRFG